MERTTNTKGLLKKAYGNLFTALEVVGLGRTEFKYELD